MARKEKQPVHHVVMTDGKRASSQQLLQEYDIETAEDIQDALKDLLGGTIKEMMEAEMDDHLGYGKSERIERSEQSDYRNGTKQKSLPAILFCFILRKAKTEQIPAISLNSKQCNLSPRVFTAVRGFWGLC